MDDHDYEKLSGKLFDVEFIIRDLIRPKLKNWDKDPLSAIQVAKQCAFICKLMIEISDKALREVRNEKQNRSNPLGNINSSVDEWPKSYTKPSSKMGSRSKRDKRRHDDTGSS